MTTRTIPVQVDGEAVRLNPCTIEISHLNKARILAKKKARRKICDLGDEQVMVVESTMQEVAVDVCVVPLHLYKELSSDKDKLMESSITVGALILDR